MSHISHLFRFVRSKATPSRRRSKRGCRATTGRLIWNNPAERFARPMLEQLEERRVLNGDQWIMAFRDLTLGTTPEEQVQAGQAYLQEHGINDVQIVAALDLEGTFLIE